MKRWFLGGLLLALVSATVQAGEPLVTLRLWNGKAPGEKDDIGAEKLLPPRGAKPIQRLSNVTDPTISLYKPAADKDTGAAVLVCPGGGYNILAMDLEGTEVADWLNSIGVTAIVLKYRVPRRKDLPKHQAPLQDAQRAMSLVRANAQQWEIDSPSREQNNIYKNTINYPSRMNMKAYLKYEWMFQLRQIIRHFPSTNFYFINRKEYIESNYLLAKYLDQPNIHVGIYADLRRWIDGARDDIKWLEL